MTVEPVVAEKNGTPDDELIALELTSAEALVLEAVLARTPFEDPDHQAIAAAIRKRLTPVG